MFEFLKNQMLFFFLEPLTSLTLSSKQPRLGVLMILGLSKEFPVEPHIAKYLQHPAGVILKLSIAPTTMIGRFP